MRRKSIEREIRQAKSGRTRVTHTTFARLARTSEHGVMDAPTPIKDHSASWPDNGKRAVYAESGLVIMDESGPVREEWFRKPFSDSITSSLQGVVKIPSDKDIYGDGHDLSHMPFHEFTDKVAGEAAEARLDFAKALLEEALLEEDE